jgi:hypothetical protein
MKNKVLILAALLTLAIAGCSKDNEHVQGVLLKDLSYAPFVSEYKYPDWLAKKIDGMEREACDIYAGEWNGRIVFYMEITWSSCMFCDVYYEDGEKVEWGMGETLFNDFYSESKEWVKIFKHV